MTNSEPPRRRRPTLTLDELIACIVALGTMGTILYFGTRQTEQSWLKGQGLLGTTSTAKESRVVPPLNLSVSPPIAQIPSRLAPNNTQSTPSNSLLIKPLPSAIVPNSLTGFPSVTTPPATPQGLSTPKTDPSPITASPTVTVGSTPNPLATGEAATPVVGFPDVPDGYWAKSFIGVVAGQKLMTALADGKFAPDQAMTRADFAQALQQVLALPTLAASGSYPDVAADNPDIKAIQAVTKAGFMKGYPDGQFKPNQPVTRQDVLVTLMSGLNLQPPQDAAQVLQVFQDANQIPAWANGKIAAATANNLVVNYPDVKILQSQKTATRAEVAAFLYQALVKQGKAKPMDSPYVVKK